MSVGINEIDEDHKYFASLINDFNLAVIERRELKEIQKILELIVDDAIRHFAREESLFERYHYPGAEEHAKLHAQVISALQAIRERCISYAPGLESAWINAGLELKDILLTHLLTEDMQYADYYRHVLVKET